MTSEIHHPPTPRKPELYFPPNITHVVQILRKSSENISKLSTPHSSKKSSHAEYH